jgi:hypothetical protein
VKKKRTSKTQVEAPELNAEPGEVIVCFFATAVAESV